MENPRNTKEELQTKIKHLEERLDWSLARVTSKRKQNQQKATVIKITTLICSGGATVLLGLNIQNTETILKNVAFTLTAIVTVLAALEPFFNYRALWIEHEQAKARFHRLMDDLKFYVAGKNIEQLDEKVIVELFERYQSIWDDLSDAWIQERRSEKAKGKYQSKSHI